MKGPGGGVILAFAVIVAMALIAGMCALDAWKCSARWEDSGMSHRWRVVSGCQVKGKTGWIPEEKYREVAP